MRGTACRVVRNSMTPRSRRLCGALAAALVVVGSGCSPRAPTTPSTPSSARPPVSTDFVVQGIGPVAGKPAQPTAVRIWGDGFQSGATVTFDGSATSATVESGHYILTTAPPHPAGAIDIVVINPDGRTSRLEKAFTYVENLLPGGDITIGLGDSVTATLDPFERTCTFDDTACRLLSIRAPVDILVEVELVSLDGRGSIGLYDPMPFRAPSQFPKQLTVRGGQQVWIIGDWALFNVTARLAK
jgi:hypothetical protein